MDKEPNPASYTLRDIATLTGMPLHSIRNATKASASAPRRLRATLLTGPDGQRSNVVTHADFLDWLQRNQDIVDKIIADDTVAKQIEQLRRPAPVTPSHDEAAALVAAFGSSFRPADHQQPDQP